MNELRPCPFCGSKPNVSKSNVHYGGNEFTVEYMISCPSCRVHFSHVSRFAVDKYGQVKTLKDGYKTIVDKWNTRYEEEKLPPLIREGIDDYD